MFAFICDFLVKKSPSKKMSNKMTKNGFFLEKRIFSQNFCINKDFYGKVI